MSFSDRYLTCYICARVLHHTCSSVQHGPEETMIGVCRHATTPRALDMSTKISWIAALCHGKGPIQVSASGVLRMHGCTESEVRIAALFWMWVCDRDARASARIKEGCAKISRRLPGRTKPNRNSGVASVNRRERVSRGSSIMLIAVGPVGGRLNPEFPERGCRRISVARRPI